MEEEKYLYHNINNGMQQQMQQQQNQRIILCRKFVRQDARVAGDVVSGRLLVASVNVFAIGKIKKGCDLSPPHPP